MYKFKTGNWKNLDQRITISVVCWNCNNKIASEKCYHSYNDFQVNILVLFSFALIVMLQ